MDLKNLAANLDKLPLEKLPPQKRAQLLEAAQKLAELEKFNALDRYEPFPKQREFHDLGAHYKERLFRAGNRCGKTFSVGAEVAIHATGRYPEWWKGKRFKPTNSRSFRAWVASKTDTVSRDTVQRILLGEGEPGTGTIPKDTIVELRKSIGVPGCYEYVKVKHQNGTISTIIFKAYSEGRENWQGDDLDFLWCDEEPSWQIYSEGLTRTNARDGIAVITFTPLNGPTEVVNAFADTPTRSRWRTELVMTWHDRLDWSAEKIEQMAAQYPEHEREARMNAVPVMGEGRVYNIPENLITVEPFAIPSHFKAIGGIDFGVHNTALVQLAYDPDADCVYVTHAEKIPEIKIADQAQAMKARGKGLPWSWPHDGEGHDRGTGDKFADLYRKEGVRMLPQRAQFLDGSMKVEPGIQQILARMQSGRFKVFSSCTDWLNEFRTYARKDAKILKQNDHIMDATRYAFMSLRYAVSQAEINKGRAETFRPMNINYTWMV